MKRSIFLSISFCLITIATTAQTDNKNSSSERKFLIQPDTTGMMLRIIKPDSSSKNYLNIISPKPSRPYFSNPLIIVNGEICDTCLKSIDRENIKSMVIKRDKELVDLYGERAKDGVILITTK